MYRNGKDFILLLKFDEEKRIGISLLSNITRDDASLTNNEYRKMNNSTSGRVSFFIKRKLKFISNYSSNVSILYIKISKRSI